MTRIHHLNCVEIESPAGGRGIGHCLLLEDEKCLALVDAGIGILDVREPESRLGNELVRAVGFVLDETQTAYHQIRQLGLEPSDVRHCIASHLDPDHIGGVADFPNIKLHVSREEFEGFGSGNGRYLPNQLPKNIPVRIYDSSEDSWNGLEARKVDIGFSSEIYLVPLPGHTRGHCGIAIQQSENWLFYVGDAYYYRIELETDSHPISQLAAFRADDNTLRIESIEKIKSVIHANPSVHVFSYHDPSEFPKSSTNSSFAGSIL